MKILQRGITSDPYQKIGQPDKHRRNKDKRQFEIDAFETWYCRPCIETEFKR